MATEVLHPCPVDGSPTRLIPGEVGGFYQWCDDSRDHGTYGRARFLGWEVRNARACGWSAEEINRASR